jgi:hypothetical protein
VVASKYETYGAQTRPRYVPCDPGAFRAGDVVEMAFSLVAVPIEEKRRLLSLNLKALTLIDDTIRKVSKHIG